MEETNNTGNGVAPRPGTGGPGPLPPGGATAPGSTPVEPIVPERGTQRPPVQAGQRGEGGSVTLRASERLSQREAGTAEQEEQKGQAKGLSPRPLAEMLKDLSSEDLQTLKAALEMTPSRQTNRVKTSTCRLRKIGEKIVIDFQAVYQGYVHDKEQRRDVEVPFIPVRFYGDAPDAKYTDIPYKEFMDAPWVVCEIKETRRKVEEVSEGETVNRAGKVFELLITVPTYFHYVKMPDGEVVEIRGDVPNG